MRRNAAVFTGLALAATLAVSAPDSAWAQDNIWRIAKVTGQAWLGGDGVATVALSQESVLKPGDSIRTGRNGRVLLVRGAETMMVSANSAISLPEAGRAGMTTVIQQAGSILLDVEKRNVQHFEVETPYLAAVVKGTRFTVTVANGRAQVNVARGQVQVADFRSGQFALVLPGQIARAAQRGVGLQLSGAGALGAIQQGPAQAPRVTPLAVPQQGFTAAPVRTDAAPARPVLQEARAPRDGGIVRGPGGALRISAPMGEVKLDINKVTKGLARSEAGIAAGQGRKSTVWNKVDGTAGRSERTGNSGNAEGVGQIASAAATAANSSTARGNSVAALQAALGQSDVRGNAFGRGNGNGNGNGGGNAGGNGNGNGAANGNDNANANGNGAGNDNANGNSGSGNAGNGNSGRGLGNDPRRAEYLAALLRILRAIDEAHDRARNNGSGNGKR